MDAADGLVHTTSGNNYLISILERAEVLKIPVTLVIESTVHIVSNQKTMIEFDYLLGKGIEEGAAELIRTAGAGVQFIEICNRIKYMFSRSHAISYMLRVWRLVYYKIYYPDIYEKCEKTYVQKNVLDV